MIALLAFVALLLVLIIVHEAGHALVARANGCRVEEFGFGFPPRLASVRMGETLFSLNALPLGGFVRLTGEHEAASSDPRSFAAKSALQRAVILAGGVGANLLLAWILFSIIAAVGFRTPAGGTRARVSNQGVEIVLVEGPSVATAAGLRAGDVIRTVAGVDVQTAEEAARRIREFEGSTLPFQIRRGSSEETLILQFPTPKVRGQRVGLALLDVGTIRVPWYQSPLEGARMTGRMLWLTGRGFAHLLRTAFLTQRIPEEISGPVGIAALTGTIAKQGITRLLEFAGILSVNLAFINALPIPALDGGRLLFLILDTFGLRGFRGRPERVAHALGFVLLLLLLLAVTASDVKRLLYQVP